MRDILPSDLQVAVGIYDISAPLAVLERSTPKPAQIYGVEYIDSTDQIALLFIKETVKLNYYTLPICVDRQKGIPFYSFDDCVVTGWGSDNTYHFFDVELLSRTDCQKYGTGSCAKPHNPAKVNVCDLVEYGGGLQCRYLGDRKSRKNDIYWLKGTLRGCNADQVLLYDHLDIEWFEMALMNQRLP